MDPEVIVSCPYCGSDVWIVVDSDGGAVQEYIEDCAICCRPWQLTVRLDRETGATTVEARTEQE